VTAAENVPSLAVREIPGRSHNELRLVLAPGRGSKAAATMMPSRKLLNRPLARTGVARRKRARAAPAKTSSARSRPAADAPFWRRAWHFLWYEDSLASWLVNIVLAFVLIKFLLYPGLGLVLGTHFPVVAVVSSSMEHHPGSFEQWWGANQDFYLAHNITEFDFLSYPFHDGFNKGDIMVLAGVDPATVRLGTIIVYWSGKPYPIIHRYIGRNNATGMDYLMSKGDNNPGQVIAPDLDERRIPPGMVVGRAVVRIPYLGWVKIGAVDLLGVLTGR